MSNDLHLLGKRVPAQPPVDTPTPLLFLGEAPGEDEVGAGRPLVGASGRTFTQMMNTAGLNRNDYAITNVFDEKLPGNDIRNWTIPLKDARGLGLTDIPPVGGAGFLCPQYRWHLERLQAEIEAWRPVVIVPLGATALWALTGSTQISSVRGHVTLATRLTPGTKLLPTFHPQFVNYQWKMFLVVVGDLIKAHVEAQRGRDIILPQKEIYIEPTLDDLRAWLPALLASDLLSVDIETGWGQITNIGFAPDAAHGYNVPFFDKRSPAKSYWPTVAQEFEAWQFVRKVLEAPVPKLGQNFGAYDAFWLIDKKGIGPRNFSHDTRLAHHALYPEMPKDLGFMGASYTQQGAWKHWGKKQGKRDDR